MLLIWSCCMLCTVCLCSVFIVQVWLSLLIKWSAHYAKHFWIYHDVLAQHLPDAEISSYFDLTVKIFLKFIRSRLKTINLRTDGKELTSWSTGSIKKDLAFCFSFEDTVSLSSQFLFVEITWIEKAFNLLEILLFKSQ